MSLHPFSWKDSPSKYGICVPSVIQQERLELEQALETEINSFLSDPSTKEHAEAYARTLMAATALAAVQRGLSQVSMEEDISESEFADDPEVASCVLSPEEQEIKERIWVHENRDYLRDQQRKMLRKQLDEKNGIKKAVRKRKRKGRIGEGGDGRDEVRHGWGRRVRVFKRRVERC